MNNYYYDDRNRFIIEDYNNTKPFASFLPGIAGKMGIPMWVFYVNRGQCISSFGVRDKNSPIMEFFPANKAYMFVPYTGFRTFVKIKKETIYSFYEPFALNDENKERIQCMKIKSDNFEIEELSQNHGLLFNIEYFTLANEDFAGLVRIVRIKNISSSDIDFELLDGLPIVIPYGASEFSLKSMNYTLESWMRVENLDNRVPFYKMAQLPGDKPSVEEIDSGNFYLAFLQKDNESILLEPLVDSHIIFGHNRSFHKPDSFIKTSIKQLYNKKQIHTNKTPCGFFGANFKLNTNQEIEIFSIIGQVNSVKWLNSHIDRIATKKYINTKKRENIELISSIANRVYTRTASNVFDLYCQQTYLDNVLRGGYPMIFENEERKIIFHSYLRKHGDMERDYNFFSLEPTYYSQGNGNYRDVNQNRRCEVLLDPQVQHANILTFMNLIQTDGYNPLELRGSNFSVLEKDISKILSFIEDDKQAEVLKVFLLKPFTPGSLIKFVKIHEIRLNSSLDEFLQTTLLHSEQNLNVIHGDGYWIDHWTYILDLIENYLVIYPDKKHELLFELSDFSYYDNPVIVQPREKKYVSINNEGKVRQLGSILFDKQKEKMINSRDFKRNLVRTKNGTIYKTTLFSKLLNLVLIKFTTLDPYGMGVEMEANKPGWYDALNGLPGIFGSSMPETYELKRLIQFMIDSIDESKDFMLRIPIEVYDLLNTVKEFLDNYFSSQTEDKQFTYWDCVTSKREVYRKITKFGFDGHEKQINLFEVKYVLGDFLQKIEQAITSALELTNDRYPTYFYYDVERFKFLHDEQGNKIINVDGFPCVKILQFKPMLLSLFLEGFVRAIKVQSHEEEAKKIWNQVRESSLFDRKLKMYKLNSSLENEPNDIGRAKAFTPGWLENESIWTHMEYKFLLEVLKTGLYDEFFEDFRNVLIPFQDPQVYGRSPAENSSFIVSSVFPDETLHGTGFYARLSGSTAEFLNIWFIMMVGKQPFFMKDDELHLEFKPILPDWLFDRKGEINFKFLGRTMVCYHNPERKDTFTGEIRIKKIKLTDAEDKDISIIGSDISFPYASMVRSGNIKTIDIYFEAS
ncbi:MAG: cellobiose phosphorylase [Promethearchaeota archaeon]